METISVKINDAAFHQSKSQSAQRGETADLEPKYIEWYRGSDYRDVCFFTDSTFHHAPNTDAKLKVAWLLEPYPFRQQTYDYVFSHLDEFDYVLTYAKKYIDNKKVLFYPYGGTMIKTWGLQPKIKLCSIIVSQKEEATGHKIRNQIAQQYKGQVDVFGQKEFTPKRECLQEYAYSIVVLGERLDWCFDEKLIDCFALGTIPILWGCPDIHRFFTGVISFNTPEDLAKIMLSLSFEQAANKVGSIDSNKVLAREFTCVEDWLYLTYPFLFI